MRVMLTGAQLMALASACAPQVAPTTMAAVVAAESGGNPYAVHVNGAPQVHKPKSAVEASVYAKALIAEGRSVDLGLGQINSRNLNWLRLTVDEAFQPCANLAASALVLRQDFQRARDTGAAPQTAVRAALSFYNTGTPDRGFSNGYVARVVKASATLPPPISSARTAPEPVAPQAWNVFARAAAETFVLHIEPEALP